MPRTQAEVEADTDSAKHYPNHAVSSPGMLDTQEQTLRARSFAVSSLLEGVVHMGASRHEC